MLKIIRSEHSVKGSLNDDPIILMYQFFKHKDKSRHKEVQECLQKNVNSKLFDRIILLNERNYTSEELGVSIDLVEQINIGHRLYFSDIFDYVDNLDLKGYIVTCNADIFFDKSLQNIKYTHLHDEKMIYAQLRFEYTDKNLSKCKIFGPRCDSQDTWIFHTECNIPEKFRKQFKIHYGIGNCDLKLTYLYSLLNFKIINDPYFVKTYHIHNTNIRDYYNKPAIQRPTMFVIPYFKPKNDYSIYPMNMWCGKSGMSFYDYFDDEKNFIDEKDMVNITGVINYAFNNNLHFSIPKTELHSVNLIYLFNMYIKAYKDEDKHRCNEIISLMQGSFSNLSYRGLKLDTIKKLSLYANKYMEIFSKSQISIHIPAGHLDYIDLLENNNNHKILSGPKIHKFLLDHTRKYKKIPVGVNILNIGAHMFKQGWFDIIENKNILVISQHYKAIEMQINKQNEKKINYYKRAIFRNCSYTFMDIPELVDDEEDFTDVINKYIKMFGEKLNKNSFDIAFIGDTPYDFFILDYLHMLGKSGICCGSFLPLWYGLYNKAHLKDNRDIIKMFMNEHWNMI